MLLVTWLGYLRGAVMRKFEGLTDDDVRWTPEGALISLLGIADATRELLDGVTGE